MPCWDVSCTPSAGKSLVKHGSAWSNTANATVSCVVKRKPWWRQKHIWIQMEKMQNPGLIFLIKFFMWKASKKHFFRSGKGGVLLLMDLIHANYLGTSPINLYFPGLISTKTWVQPFLLQSACFQNFSHLIPSHLVLVVAILIFLGENGKVQTKLKVKHVQWIPLHLM